MAIRQVYEEQYTNIPSLTKIFARGIGAGASSLTGVKGVTSIAWVSTGKYTITLPKKFSGLVGFQANVINSAGTTLSVAFLSADAALSAGTLTMEVFGGLTTVAPTRRDLTSADILLLEISLVDSATKPAGY